MSVEKFLAGTPVKEFSSTPEGLELLEYDVKLQAVVSTFAETEGLSAVADHEKLGQGKLGVVVGVGDLAVKVSTRETNMFNRSPLRRADNLITQFTYMTGLRKYLENRPGSNIHVPEQYLAVRTKGGNFLSVQERVYGHQPLSTWDGPTSIDERNAILNNIGSRLIEGVPEDETELAIGMQDLAVQRTAALGYNGVQLNGSNILIPSGSENPDEGDLVIIDQPGPFDGKAAARAATRYLTEQAGGNRRAVLRHYQA